MRSPVKSLNIMFQDNATWKILIRDSYALKQQKHRQNLIQVTFIKIVSIFPKLASLEISFITKQVLQYKNLYLVIRFYQKFLEIE